VLTAWSGCTLQGRKGLFRREGFWVEGLVQVLVTASLLSDCPLSFSSSQKQDLYMIGMVNSSRCVSAATIARRSTVVYGGACGQST
jgi:hypothetical protein